VKTVGYIIRYEPTGEHIDGIVDGILTTSLDFALVFNDRRKVKRAIQKDKKVEGADLSDYSIVRLISDN